MTAGRFVLNKKYWNSLYCTHSFTEIEIDLLISALFTKFGLVATKNKSLKLKNGTQAYLIRFNNKKENISKLRSLVRPHFLASHLYKLEYNKYKLFLTNVTPYFFHTY
jgi:hypothetical protein